MVLDTETTGLPTKLGSVFCGPPAQIDLYNSARLVELAYIVIDSDTKVEIKRHSVLVKPTFTIPNAEFHGITQDLAERDGLDLCEVLAALHADLQMCTFLVAHNVEFDTHILRSECYRAGAIALAELIESRTLQCTMKMGTIPWGKWPKLSELHTRLCPGPPIVQSHRALGDTELCLDCYRILA
jgi:DNA polymerase-3 subunit alpha